MSTVAPKSPPPAPTRATAEHRQFIDEQIARTRRSLQWTDFAMSAVGLLTALLLFLLAAAVLDHWVFRGGLSVPVRGGLFALLIAGASVYGWRTLAPLLRPINPAFAAQTIERHSPSLKNSLLNLLMFRNGRQRMSAKVYDAIEQQAAERLALSDVDDAVDKSAALRRGYWLLAVTVLCAAYAVLSPKDMTTSASRVFLPWADIAAPSRVRITDVDPGDGETARGDMVKVSALVAGAREDEPVTLHYRAADESDHSPQPVQTITLHAVGEADAAGRRRFDGQLPPPGARGASLGLQDPIQYWLEAGDGRTRTFRLDLFAKPTMVVQRVRYEPPGYTGLPSTEAVNTGDIEGLEGTQVTVAALANRAIRSAFIDFDADGTRDLAMQVDGDQATATFKLALRDDRRTPWHKSYVLRFTDEEGRTNTDPARYRIAVTADYAPEVLILEPEAVETTVAVNEKVAIAVDARDPDFALATVRVAGEADGNPVDVGTLLTGRHDGRFQGTLQFTPAEARLQPGQVLEYWAVAEDNRRPQANVTTTPRQRLRIASPADPPPDGQPQQGDQPQENNPGDGGGQGEGAQDQPDGGQGSAVGGAGNGAQNQNEPANADQNQTGEGGQGDSDQADQQDNGEGDQQQGEGQEGAGLPGGGSAGSDSGEQGDQNQTGDGGESGEGGPQQGNQDPLGGAGDGAQPPGDSAQPNQAQPNGQDNPGDQPPGAGEANREPVSANGDDDGAAFDRMLEHFNQQNENTGQQDGNAAQDGGEGANGEQGAAGQQRPEAGATDAAQGGGQSQNQDQDPQGNADGDRRNNQPGAEPSDNPADSSGANAGQQQPGEVGDAGNGVQQQSDDQRDPGDNANQQPGQRPEGPQGESAGSPPGEGGDEQFAEPNSNGNQANGDEQPGESPSDVTNSNQGAGGSGSQPDEPGASPDAGQPPQQGDKTDRDPDGADPQSDEAASGGQSERESDSTGGQSGDQSGGGSRGAGQRSNDPGQGAPGENTAADDGAGAADQPGLGETGERAGGDELADGQTGESSGDQPGAGSQSGDTGERTASQQPGDAGEPKPSDANGSQSPVSDAGNGVNNQPGSGDQQPGAESDPNQQGEQPGQQPGQQPSADGQPGEAAQPGDQQPPQQPEPSDSAPSSAGASSQQGGSGGSAGGAPPPAGEGLGGDEANLDYARKQTDLVLNRLDEQLADDAVDPELLKKLGWTQEQLRAFVERWKALKQRAAAPGEAGADAQVELDQALRDLGVLPGAPAAYDAQAGEDDLRDLSDAYRAQAPREYQERVRAYVRGAAAADDSSAD